MKIFKYLIFVSILCVALYRASNEKGFRRWFISFTAAIIVTAALTGLTTRPVEAIEPYVIDDLPSIERPLKISGGDQSKFGPGARARADASKSSITARNRAKPSGSHMFAEGFTQPYCPSNNPIRYKGGPKLNREQFNQNQSSSSSMEQMCRALSEEYREYQQNFNSPVIAERFDTTYYQLDEFKQLAKDAKANNEVFGKTTCDEARAAVQAEKEGIVENPQRIAKPYCKSLDLDFQIDGPPPYTHMDVKHPVGSRILIAQNSPNTIQEMAYNMGKKIVAQKENFCGFEQGPESAKNVLHIVDLGYVPSHEKEIVKEYCVKGAEDIGNSDGIVFLNDK